MSVKPSDMSPLELNGAFQALARFAPGDESSQRLALAVELLRLGADPEADIGLGLSAMSAILAYNQRPLFDAIVSARPAIKQSSRHLGALLREACSMQKSFPMAARLVELGADPNERSLDGLSPLRCAVKAGAAESVEILIAAGARADERESSARASLASLAGADYRGARMLSALAGAGADLNAMGPHGTRPLHEACARWGKNKGAIAKALLDLGAEPNSLSARGQTPLAYAMARTMPSRYGHQPQMNEAIAYLLERGADPSAPDANGQAPWDPDGWYGSHESRETLRRHRERVEINAVAAPGLKAAPKAL